MVRTLLVIDSESEFRAPLAAMLRVAGYRVLEAANSGIASVILDQKLKIDLLFTDVFMPFGPDGIELAERAKRLDPTLRVVYASCAAGYSRIRNYALLHRPIVSKPYLPSDILAVISTVLETSVDAILDGYGWRRSAVA